MSRQDRYAVFGNPIAHSLSPEIHQAFASQCGESIQYDKLCVEQGNFDQAADAFFAAGGCGLNVTVPFKHDACEYADELSERAKLAGAANFLMPRDGKIFADNTDGYGLVMDLRDSLGWPLKNQRVLILGAGGAVRGVLLPLLKEKPEQIVIANRTVSRAQALADRFAAYGPVEACGFGQEANEPFDLVINGTSASLSGDVPAISSSAFDEHTRAYDMVYGKEPTAFMRWAQEHRMQQVSDGLGMLIGQAAESYYLWRGVKIDIARIKQQFS